MPEDELRSALRALAEPTSPPPGGRDEILAETARRRRRRQGGAALVGAVATLTVVGTVALAASRFHERRSDPAMPTDGPTITSPYDAPPCPDRLPDLDQANTQIPDLTGAQSIRLCQDPRDWEMFRDPPTQAELASSLGPEALVRDLDEFVNEVGRIPVADPGRCETVSIVQTRSALVVRYTGATVIVPVAGCFDLHLDDRVVDGSAILHAFVDALDRQRDRFSYTRQVDAALTCRTFRGGGPSKPGREQLLKAVRCDPSAAGEFLDPTPLSEEGVRQLQEAWTLARPHPPSSPTDREDECTELEERPSDIMARTDRGDVIRFFESPCGYLVFSGSRPGELLEVPVTFDDLF